MLIEPGTILVKITDFGAAGREWALGKYDLWGVLSDTGPELILVSLGAMIDHLE